MDPYEELRVLRTRKRWGQRELGAELGISAATVNRMEQPGGLEKLAPAHLLKLSKLLGISPGDLAEAIVNYNNKPKGENDAVHS